MKDFVRNIVLFVLPVLVFAAGLEWLAESIPNSYTYKREYMERNGSRIHTLFLGSSNAYDGFAASAVPGAFNIANSSQTLEDDYRLLERYIDSLDSLQTVVLGLGYHSLGLNTKANRRTYYTIYMNLYPRWPLNAYSFEIFNLELLTKKIIKYAISRDVTRCDAAGQRIGHNESAVAHHTEFWNRDVAGMAAGDRMEIMRMPDLINRNYGYICRIIDLCHVHGILPVIVNMPAMEEYRQQLPQEQLALQDTVLSYLSPYAFCIDASSWSIPDGGWYNATHLTREASVDFTKRVMDSIR